MSKLIKINIKIGSDLHKALKRFGTMEETFDQVIRRILLANADFKAVFDEVAKEST